MAIYRGKGGKTDVVPADGDQEFAGSIIAEKDIHAHGNISADGDITVGGDIIWEGTITGDGSGLENVPTPFLIAEDCIYLNGQEVTGDHSIPTGMNGMSAGEITIASGGSVYVPEGSSWITVGEEDGVTTLESLGIPNHDLVNVDLLGNVTATSFIGDGSQLTGLPLPDLDELGLVNHELIEVDPAGGVTVKNLKTEEHIEFPDGTKQTTASTQLDGYTKAEIDASQGAQDTKINKNTADIAQNTADIAAIPAPIDTYTKSEIDASQATQDAEIDTKIGDAPSDGKPYARKNKGWHEVEAGTGDVEEAPKDGKTYGRKNEAWSEVTSDSYTKAEIDAQQLVQDAEITANTTDIADNATDIAKNKTDIAALALDIDALTGSIVYKGSLNATVTPAPADAVEGDMYINDYNVDEPATNYPVASGWAPVTEVKYDDKLIKTDTGWDLIASVVGVPSYTAGEIDALLDDKADKGDSYLKAETDALLDDKADSDSVYTKAESDATNEAQDVLIQANADAIDALPSSDDYYNKTEIDGQYDIQEAAIQANTDAIADLPTPVDAYTKDEIDAQQTAQNDVIDTKADTGDSYLKAEADTLLDNKANVGDSYTKVESDTALDLKADKATTYTKTEVDSSQTLQNTEIAKKANQVTTYTKDEVDDLLESASGAIVGNYTHKQASSVARDPGAGNLYLVAGMSFTTNYDDVTTIYISDTDGAADVRDFDKVKVGDKITLTSEDGSGEYTIVTLSDVTGYRELVVSKDTTTGTIADDTPVSIVLDVASSEAGGGTVADGCIYLNNQTMESDYTIPVGKNGMSAGAIEFNGTLTVPAGSKYHVIDDTSTGGGTTVGGIEEAPEDGKQYARKDAGWSEVEATSGGGGVEATPPVAFGMYLTAAKTTVPSGVETKIPFDTIELDTDNGGQSDGTYIVQKDGIYSISYQGFISSPNGNDSFVALQVDKGTGFVSKSQSRLQLNTSTKAINIYVGGTTLTIELKKGDVLAVVTDCVGNPTYIQNGTGIGSYNCSLSGHMVSSFTEGEVKEKEAVVFRADSVTTQSVVAGFNEINLSEVFNTNGEFVSNRYTPKVAGYYQVSASCTVQNTKRAFVQVDKYASGTGDGLACARGGDTELVSLESGRVRQSTLSTIVYMNGTTDSLAMSIYVATDTSVNVNSLTYLSAHLITGQSSGGEAIEPKVINLSANRNLIINGDMRIDQRNSGTSVTPVDAQKTMDRWATIATASSKLSIEQNAGSVTPPVGFSNYLGITSLSAYSVGAADIFGIQQRIEGFNTSNLGWGTANAQTVTLSAWVYSSLTGTFGGALINGAQNYSYPFTYTISSANTWTKINVTISGATSGDWVGSTNGVGLQVNFCIGGSSTYSGTAGAWDSQQKYTATGATSVVGTSGATFYITGIQLEASEEATPFEHVPYDVNLQRCQRYFSTSYGNNPVGTNTWNGTIAGRNYDISAARNQNVVNIHYPVQMRAVPTLTAYSKAGKIGNGVQGSTSVDLSTVEKPCSLVGSETILRAAVILVEPGTFYQFHYTADAEL